MTGSQRARAAYAIIVGMFMGGFWLMLYLSGGIPELRTASIEIGYHLIAELSTAVLLVAAGFGLFRGSQWAERLYPVSLGMLLYTVINSAGYYAQLGDVAMVGMFTVLTVLTLILLIHHVGFLVTSERSSKERHPNTGLEEFDA